MASRFEAIAAARTGQTGDGEKCGPVHQDRANVVGKRNVVPNDVEQRSACQRVDGFIGASAEVHF